MVEIGRKKSARSKPRMGPYYTKNSTMRGTIVVRPAWKSHSVLYVRLPNDRRLAPLKESSSNVTIYIFMENIISEMVVKWPLRPWNSKKEVT